MCVCASCLIDCMMLPGLCVVFSLCVCDVLLGVLCVFVLRSYVFVCVA